MQKTRASISIQIMEDNTKEKKQHCRKYRFPLITKKDFKDYNDSKVLVVQ
jgi:hypothetical protein